MKLAKRWRELGLGEKVGMLKKARLPAIQALVPWDKLPERTCQVMRVAIVKRYEN